MTSIKLTVTGAHAWASVTGPLTSGMVGIPVTIEYDEAWDGLTKNLMCRCSPWGSDKGEIRAILNVGESAAVAHEIMQSDMYLYLGVEGFTGDGQLVIPTTWAECGKIEYGASTCEDPSADPELSVWNQLQTEMEQLKEYTLSQDQVDDVQAYAQEATQAAQEAKQAADEAKQAASLGGKSLYYTPAVSQPTSDTLKFEFKPSVTGAPIPNPVMVKLPVGTGADSGQNGVYYIATNYGIRTEAEDNTPALQELVDTVSAKGGGIIFFPVGTYNFKKAATRYAVELKSNVSIVGENIDATVFKQTEASPYSMFYRMATADDPLVGCCFSNFTVDAYATGNTNQVFGKAFYAQYLRDCVFRDLRLLGTIATALGIDYLDRVAIENVNCVDCGRTYTGAQSGTSGIGIGTGGWEEENFTIANCVCVGSGQFGIFIENQHVLGWGGNVDYSKGCVISNCIVRGGLNHGIGIRGGENVTVIGCETYENAKHGIYLDNKCRNVKILDCSSTANGASGAYLNQNSASGRIVVRGCTFVENAAKGIHVATASDKLCIANNLTDDNEVGLYIGAGNLHDCVIQGNALLDDWDISASFSGNTDYNDLLESVEIVAPTAITANAVEVAEGRTASVVYNVAPSEASKEVTFVSSNTNIATVDSHGIVTGVAIGSCDITITSKLDDTVNYVVTCTVVEFAAPDEITILSSDLTVGKGIDDTGAEVTRAGAGLSGYIDVVGGGDVLVTLKSFKPSIGTNLAEYDSEKNFITKKSIYAANNTVLQNEYPLSLAFTADTKYIRLAVNDVTGVHKNTVCVIESAKRVDRLTVSDLVADTKINPDGSTGTQSGAYASEYIGAPAGASKEWITGYSYPGRLCTYDSDKALISEYSNGMTQKVLNGVMYDVSDVSWLRFCTSASTPPGASDVIELCWV